MELFIKRANLLNMKWAYKFKVLLIGGFVVEAFDQIVR
jgi:hypothetical protein